LILIFFYIETLLQVLKILARPPCISGYPHQLSRTLY
jgi:hypothetical protein